MGTTPTASRLRQEIARLARQRESVEKKLLSQRLPMLDACLIARRQLAAGKLRKTPAYYLSRKVEARTRLVYVRLEQLAQARGQTGRWKEFSAAVAAWVKLTRQMETLFRQLGRSQVVTGKEP